MSRVVYSRGRWEVIFNKNVNNIVCTRNSETDDCHIIKFTIVRANYEILRHVLTILLEVTRFGLVRAETKGSFIYKFSQQGHWMNLKFH